MLRPFFILLDIYGQNSAFINKITYGGKKQGAAPMECSTLDNDIRFYLMNNLLINSEVKWTFSERYSKLESVFVGSSGIVVEPMKLISDDASHSRVGIEPLLYTGD